MSNTLTCVYCGMAYPEGTPPHGSQVLTDHIKACGKHPMRKTEATNKKLRSALAGLIGASTKEELKQLEVGVRLMPGVEADKIAALNGIHALLETMD